MSFTDITVLDVSKTSLEKAKQRLLEKGDFVKWVELDVANFQPDKSFDVWHDRAVFHFLTNKNDIQKYVELISNSLVKNGHFIIGAFSVDGPQKCSGLEIVQYSEESMLRTFGKYFVLDKSLRIDHVTPSGSKQNYLFFHFIRKWLIINSFHESFVKETC